jgi:CRISPR/Cas system-associated exonuclease Cas4 (RecB family)
VWIDLDTDELVVVDYKSTSSKDEVNLNKDWQISYKRQMEFYQWLLRQNGFKVSNDGYFVYCNGVKDKDSFDEVLEFRVKVLHYEGNDSWVKPTILQIREIISNDKTPDSDDECSTCSYVDTRFELGL